MGTGAVSRYKLSRSQKSITVQDLNCGQMRVSGCNNHYQFVLNAGAKAKSVTNNLPILSVLGLVFIIIICESFNSIILFCNISLRMFVLTLILQFKPTTDENPY